MPDSLELLIERRGNGALGREEALMAELARDRGVAVHYASTKQVERGKFTNSASMVAIGSVPFVKHSLRQLGKALPEHTPYPPVLHSMLHREVRRLGALREARVMITQGKRLFVKPADGWKRFNGFVTNDPRDMRFNGASANGAVWVSEPVEFVSEWRAYVAMDRVLDVRFSDHGGERGAAVDRGVIEDAVQLLGKSGEAPAGYVMDFGVLKDSGKTALIEVNDGFSFGAYDGVPAEVYWDVSVGRWAELVR